VGRIIKLDGAGKVRKHLSREILLAVRTLMMQKDLSEQTRDLAALISINLELISKTIDDSVSAWEKRGYWVKADRFRMEWSWCDSLSKTMKDALMSEDWPAVASTAARVAEKLRNIHLPNNHGLGHPWSGAWKRLQRQENNT